MKINKKNIKQYIKLTTLSLGMVLLAKPSLALPKYDSGNVKLNDLQAFARAQDPLLQGSQILGDDRDDVIYVSPSSKKSQAGAYRHLASPACDVLKKHYDLTYLVPNVPAEKYADYAKYGPFSPFFDIRIGNYSSIVNRIMGRVEEIEKSKTKNPKIKAHYQEVFNDYNKAINAYEALSADFDTNLRQGVDEQLLASIDDELQTKAEEVIALKEQSNKAYLELMASYDKAVPQILEKHF